MNLYEKVEPYLKEEWRNDCHRGYTGQWKIENGKLYLINLFHGTSTSPLPLDSIFGISGKQPIEASWFSGELHLVRGGRLIDSYEFRDVFKKEIFCEIKEGTVIRQKTYNNSFTLGDREALKQCQEELRKKEIWSKLPELKDITKKSPIRNIFISGFSKKHCKPFPNGMSCTFVIKSRNMKIG